MGRIERLRTLISYFYMCKRSGLHTVSRRHDQRLTLLFALSLVTILDQRILAGQPLVQYTTGSMTSNTHTART